jgi:hypothetical protein
MAAGDNPAAGECTAMSDVTDQRVETDRTALLNQLRIDRSEPPSSGGHSKWWATALAVIVIAATGVWYLIRPTGFAVTTAVAQALPNGASAANSATTLLDASGYIVARRRATVSAKVTGKVVKVMLEEGQRVEAGDIIARLDDSNWKAERSCSKPRQVSPRRRPHSTTPSPYSNAAKSKKRQPLSARKASTSRTLNLTLPITIS